MGETRLHAQAPSRSSDATRARAFATAGPAAAIVRRSASAGAAGGAIRAGTIAPPTGGEGGAEHAVLAVPAVVG